MAARREELVPILALAARHPLVLGILGWLVSAVSAFLFFYQALPEYRSFPNKPVPMSASEAMHRADLGNATWVTLTDVAWDCRRQMQGGKVVVLAGPGGRAFVAELEDGGACERQ